MERQTALIQDANCAIANNDVHTSTWRLLFKEENKTELESGCTTAKFSPEQIEEEFNCPVCHDLLSDPRLLSCAHSFCAKCIVNSIEKDYNGTAKQLLNENQVQCFSCSKISVIPKEGLPKNFALASLIDKKKGHLQTNQIAANELICADCKKADSLENTHICASCDEQIFCSNCLIKKHRSHETSDYVTWDDINKKRNLLREKCGKLLSQTTKLAGIQKEFATYIEYSVRFSDEFSHVLTYVGNKITDLESRINSAKAPTEVEINEMLNEVELGFEGNEMMTSISTRNVAVQVFNEFFGEISLEDALLGMLQG